MFIFDPIFAVRQRASRVSLPQFCASLESSARRYHGLQRLRRAAVLLCVVSMLFAGAVSAFAQQGTGSIVGRVSDALGAVIPSATVTITNQATLTGTIVKTNAEGAYASPPLNSGLYTVQVEKTGFGPSEQRDFELNDDQAAQLNFTLRVGDVSQQVEVQADAPTLNSFNATLGTVIDNATAEALPLNGSVALAQVQLDSSVVSAAGPNNDGFVDRGLNVSNIRIGGGAAGSNANLLDGANNLQNVRGEVLINSTITGLQETRLQYGVLSSQYGLTSGGVITMTTKAGTNGFHGQIYEFFKNGAMNAANRFALPGIRPIMTYNQYGAAIGGPIKHNRAFFFANYEAYGLNQVSPTTINVPTLAERTGDFSDLAVSTPAFGIFDPDSGGASGQRTQYPGNVIPTKNLDPAALAFQDAFVPVPNAGDPSLPVNNYISNAPLISTQIISLGRVDIQVTNRTSLFARYAFSKNMYNNEGNYGALNTIASTRNDVQTSQDLNIGITQVISGNMLNDIRLAVGRSFMPFNPGSAFQNWPQQLGISNLPPNTLPQISITNYGIQVSTNQGLRTSTDPELSDTITLLRGRHSFHLGAGFRFNEAYANSNSAPSGQYSFNTSVTAQRGSTSVTTGNAYASFLLGKPSSVYASVSAGSVTRAIAVNGFIQDDWRVTSRLNLNLGLRYDYQSIPWEKANGFSTLRLQPNPTNGLIGTEVYAGMNGQHSNFAAENYTDFAPRIGFAFLLSQKHLTVLRGGYALYYANTFNMVYANANDEFGTNVTTYSATTPNGYITQFSSGLPYPPNAILGAGAGPNALLGQVATYQTPRAPTPASQQFVLSLDRQFPHNSVIHLGYFMNHGTHFPLVAVNLDQISPSYFSLGDSFLNANSTNPYAHYGIVGGLGNNLLPNATLLKPYPYFQGVYSYYPHIGRFLGSGGQLAIQRPITKALQMNVSYTYSKFLSDPLVSSLTAAAISSPLQNSLDPHSEYAVDPTDVTHRLSGTLVYQLPFGKRQHFFSGSSARVNRFIGGWSLSSIFTIESGRPLAVTGSNGYVARRPNYVPSVALKVAHPGIVQWFNPSAFTSVAPCSGSTCGLSAPLYSFGSVPRTETQVRGPGNININLNILKHLQFGRYSADLQAAAFNAINHPNLGTPNTSYSATSSSFGTITSALPARTLQLTVRLRF